jgi:hypothetical protein
MIEPLPCSLIFPKTTFTSHFIPPTLIQLHRMFPSRYIMPSTRRRLSYCTMGLTLPPPCPNETMACLVSSSLYHFNSFFHSFPTTSLIFPHFSLILAFANLTCCLLDESILYMCDRRTNGKCQSMRRRNPEEILDQEIAKVVSHARVQLY